MKKLYYSLDRFCENRWFPLLFIPIATCFLLLFSFTTSPLFLNDGRDSAVFKTMGLALLKGKILYHDIFDHKGPILYYINAFGQWIIPGRLGIFLLQVIGLSVTLLYMFKMAKLFVSNSFSFLAVLLTLFIYSGVIEEGNQCEEWMLCFFTIALYYALNYFVNRLNITHPLKYAFLYGACFGITFYIRPNDAVAIMGGIMTGMIIWLIGKKSLKNAVYNVLCFISGFLIITIPVGVYFLCNHAADEMVYGLIGFNKEYSGGGLNLLISLFNSQKLSIAVVIIAIILLVYHNEKNRIVLLVLVPMLLFELILMGTTLYSHYYIVFLPMYLIFISFITFNLIGEHKNTSLAILSIAVLFLSAHISKNSILNQSVQSIKERIIPFAHGRAYNRIKCFYEETDKVLSFVSENDKDSIWNYNLKWNDGDVSSISQFSCLWHNGIVQCNKITYASNEKLQEEDNVKERLPLWILINRDKVENDDTVVKDFIPLNYELLASTDTTICKIELYYRK